MSSSQKATGLSPRQAWLDLPKEGPPGLWVIFFSRTQLPCPAPAQPRHPTSTCPQPVVPTPAPGGRGVNGHGGGRRLCARVCYRGQNTVLSGSQRMLSLGFRNEGQRKKIQTVFQERQQQRRRRPSRASFVSRVSR